MKYIFSANIPTSSIKLIDDEDVRFFIGLNSSSAKLNVLLCVKIENHAHKSSSNAYHEYDMSYEIDKEFDRNLITLDS